MTSKSMQVLVPEKLSSAIRDLMRDYVAKHQSLRGSQAVYLAEQQEREDRD